MSHPLPMASHWELMLYNLEPIFTIALSHFIIMSIFSSSFNHHTDSLVNTQGEEENSEEKESK